ncbi:ABC transporter ATP-binding protein [Actinopolymorpha sp. B11F2]|uniref:ABC transporter ATP-binding protein n=1 Tax=Actinopolymorpha sp. B11F2 TaxID=3160862 RepID=UPI0032E49075
MTEAILQVRGLRIEFPTRLGVVQAVRGVDFDVHAGEALAIVGESGSGKSVTARSLVGLVREPGRIVDGSVKYRGEDVFAMSESALTAYRGGEVALVSQDPQSSLNPVMSVGDQIAEALRLHGADRRAARRRAAELLDLVDVPDPAKRLAGYPHQFSGGMRQRVLIAMALANDPCVIIADEPTTALDVTVQAQVLDVFARLNRELGTAVVVITHNLGLVARLCDRILVMYGGKVVEQAPVDALPNDPRHPYTWGLLKSVPRIIGADKGRLPAIEGSPPDLRQPPAGCPFAPRCDFADNRCRAEMPPMYQHGSGHVAACWRTADGLRLDPPTPTPLHVGTTNSDLYEGRPDVLALREVRKTYVVHKRRLVTRTSEEVRAVRGVDLHLRAGETVGLVGESGCGKSTLAKIVLQLERPDGGEVLVNGKDLADTHGAELKRLRRQVQLVFQDPYASLNPRHTIGDLVAEPLRIHRIVPASEVPTRVSELLELVGLEPLMANRLPRNFSGGQRQRIALARALAVEPTLLVLDEPVSALDVSLQAQIVNLLQDLKVRLGISLLFVAHDVAVVRHVSDRIAVMYLGQIVEEGSADEICASPRHPYTAALLSAVPEPDPAVERKRDRIVLRGEVPSPLDPPAGCPFHPRCPIGPTAVSGREACASERPRLRLLSTGHRSACHFAEELDRI